MYLLHETTRRVWLSVLGLALVVAPARAQHSTVRGTVALEDGSPVAKAVVEANPTSGGTSIQQAKTKKSGRFALPFVEYGTYRFAATKDGLLVRSISVKITDSSKRTESDYSSEVGALQQFPEFRVRPGRTVQIDFVMVPDSYFADAIVVAGDESATRELNEANDLAIARKFDESNAILEKLVEQGKTNAKIFYLLGFNAYAQKRTQDAMKWFEKTLELDPDQPGLHAHLGSLAHEQGDPERALELYEKELAISPEATVVAVNRAIILAELGRSDEAVAAFEKVVGLDPDEAAAYSELATLYLDAGREDDAARALQRLEELGQADPALWFNIGANLANRDLYERAEQAFRKALEIEPDFALAIRELGYLAIRQGDPSSALERFERYLELNPGATDAGDVRALCDALKAQLGG